MSQVIADFYAKITADPSQLIEAAKKSQKEMDALSAKLKEAGVSQSAYNKAMADAKNAHMAQQKAAGDAAKATQKQSLSMTDLYSATQLVAQGLQAMKQAYDFAKEGAQIEFLQSKFSNLAASIGTTSEALMDDLRTATKGTLSDMELMASATDLVSLGLAKSHDEAVRLASVSAGLGMNMNQLVLTLTNQTTMRFDALGVSVDGFDEKVKKLEETGMSANDAFKEAFLQQAEEQLLKVGNAADSAAGSFLQFEAQLKNLGDESKKTAASMAGPMVASLEDWFVEVNRVRDAIEESNGALYQQYLTGGINAARVKEIAAENARAEQYGKAWADALRDTATPALEENTQAAEINAEQLKAITDENKQFLSTLESVAGSLHDYKDGIREAGDLLQAGKITTEEHAQKVSELKDAYDDASKQIVASLLEMKYTADGVFSDEELVQYMQGLEKLGLITEADRQETMRLYQEATNLHTVLGSGAKTTDMYSNKTQNLLGRTEDAVVAFEDMNLGIKNVAEAFVDAHGPVSSVVMDLGGLPASGTMWSYYVNINVSGKVPSIPKNQSMGACFAGDTLVAMADGSRRQIEDLRIGDRVQSYDTRTRRIVAATVIQTYVHFVGDYSTLYIINDHLRVTGEHLLWDGRAWRAAREFAVGDTLVDADGEPVMVQTAAQIPPNVIVYNIHTSHETHNYFAGGILAHNAKTQNMAGGGLIDPSKFTIVGDAPGGGWTPYTEVITPDGRVLSNREAQALKKTGILDGATSASFGSEDVVFSQGAGTLYSQQQQRKKKKSGGGSSAPVISSSGSVSEAAAEVEMMQAALSADIVAGVERGIVGALQSGMVMQARAAMETTRQLAELIQVVKGQGPNASAGDIGRATFEGASKYS